MPGARLVTDVAGARALAPRWDALAVTAGRPYCAPAWMLAWWDHLAPADAELCLVALEDGERLVGLAPFYAVPGSGGGRDVRLLCAGFTARVEPLALPGHEAALARATAELLPRATLVALEGVPEASPWPEALRDAWPGRGAWLHRNFTMPAPLALAPTDGDPAAWLRSRGKNFRKEAGRVRRRIAEAGGTMRRAEAGEVDAAVEAVLRAYRARWDPRGGSERLGDPTHEFLLAAGRALAPLGRFDVWLLEAEGRAVGAELFVRAGPEGAAWGGGFEDSWSKHAPSTMLMLAAVEHLWATGAERVEFGEGDQPYKLRFRDVDAPLTWSTLVPRGPGYVRTRAQMLPEQARWWLRDHVGEREKAALKRLLRRS